MSNEVEHEALSRYLEEHGLKRTTQRDVILEAFLKAQGHVSSEDLYQTIREVNPRIGYTTVYRTMKLLCDAGLAHERHFEDGVTRYEIEPAPGQKVAPIATEVVERKLLSVPVESVDLVLTNKAYDGKTLMEIAKEDFARGVFLTKITRGAVSVNIPILAQSKFYRGDILTSHHSEHARQGGGRRGVDGDNLGVRVGAAQHGCVRHVRQNYVIGVFAVAGEQTRVLDPLHALADPRVFRFRRFFLLARRDTIAGVAHSAASCWRIRSAASSIDSTMV